jgi:hypothetical protein
MPWTTISRHSRHFAGGPDTFIGNTLELLLPWRIFTIPSCKICRALQEIQIYGVPHLDQARAARRRRKAAFQRWYDALLKTNEKVQNEERQELKDIMNRVWHMRTACGDGSDPALRKFHFEAWIAARGKCFFMTKDSRMGTGQGQVSEGNVVAVVAGLKMPLILAAVKEHFRLVGHAYVHGIMDGEAWPKDGSETKVISVE